MTSAQTRGKRKTNSFASNVKLTDVSFDQKKYFSRYFSILNNTLKVGQSNRQKGQIRNAKHKNGKCF